MFWAPKISVKTDGLDKLDIENFTLIFMFIFRSYGFCVSPMQPTDWAELKDLNHMSRDMRIPTMWYVWPAKPLISLRIRAVWSEPLLVAWVFYDS